MMLWILACITVGPDEVVPTPNPRTPAFAYTASGEHPGDDSCVPVLRYRDLDGDEHGDPAEFITTCLALDGFVGVDDDCAPRDTTSYPGAPERCDGIDHDCDGAVNDDDAIDVVPWYTDADGDGYGVEPTVGTTCSGPPGTVGRAGDCDDAAEAISPREAEVCDQLDNDCDGLIDDADDWVAGGTSLWPDRDGDGFGDELANPAWLCGATPGFVDNTLDCDDTDASICPGAHDTCRDGVDADCDGSDACGGGARMRGPGAPAVLGTSP